tara:strand:+ start:1426 stop:3693 length:2268 start_codon:yes stop_codon:yes gene_type:complete
MKLVIVESPAKCKKIESFLGDGYKCVASFGHIREFTNGLKSIDYNNNYKPSYKLIGSKSKYINNLSKLIKRADEIILATDDDREGEAISWHICDQYNLNLTSTKRIIFHEITKSAIKEALYNFTYVDMNKVYSQQARQILDLIVGYKLSPILWKHISRTSKLSAGRCQSPALRLVYDNYKELEKETGEKVYDTKGIFTKKSLEYGLNYEFKDEEKMEEFLEESVEFEHKNLGNSKKKLTKKSPIPLTTSRLQQMSSNILNYSPKQTMRCAQILYENGYITYMRTDSVKYSKEFIEKTSKYIEKVYGEEYVNSNIMKLCNKSKKKGKKDLAQEAHEAIRPTNIEQTSISVNKTVTPRELRLYTLIYKHSLASCMSNGEYMVITNTISAPFEKKYVRREEKGMFLGWRILYENDNKYEIYSYLSKKKKGEEEKYEKINSDMRLKKIGRHYNEASLVNMLEKRGIGRPSTYSSIIDKIQTKNYVKKEDVEGREVICKNYELIKDELEEKEEKKVFGNEKNKLVIQPTGIMVIEFLINNFKEVLEYDYTKAMESDLDKISTGDRVWHEICDSCNKNIEREISNIKEDGDIKIDDKYTYMIGKYGPVLKYEEDGKTKFLGLKKDIDIDKLKRGEYNIEDIQYKKTNKLILGEYKDGEVELKEGRYGMYVNYKNKNYSLKGLDKKKDEVKLNDVISYIDGSGNKKGNSNILKVINDEMSVRKGRYGPYVYYKTNNMNKPKFIGLKNKSVEEVTREWVLENL